jgi:predicted TIM-barrel fold metal-dependent hydrolase
VTDAPQPPPTDSLGPASSALFARALAPFVDELERLRPADAELIDAHTHLGLDEDGRSLDLEELLALLDAAGVGRACTFPLHDPERRPAYRLPNDRVLAWARESEGRLVPFCRLDPFDEPLAEGRRCLSAGARGIKLHPRAQSFTFDGHGLKDAISGIFALAAEAQVPILIHAGRGLPPIADGLVDLAMRYPEVVLILAHGAICDQGILTAGLADHPGVLYDTSCFYPIDVIELFARVPAERIVFGSDPPYGRPASGLYMALRCARHAGLDGDATRGVLGATMASLLDGSGLPRPRAPRGEALFTISGRLARVYGYVSATGPALFAGMLERAQESVEMALAASREPQQGEDSEALAVIGVALSAAAALLGSEHSRRAAIELLYRVMVLAATETATRRSATPRPTLRSAGAPARAR